jgi:ATP-dependent Clp protease adaptor protein ClpS
VERLASLPAIIERPETDHRGPGSGGGHWVVTVFDNDYNTADEVVLILIRATGCSLDEAQMETWEVHNLGKSVVHHGEEEECTKAADIIAQIGIRVEVTEE